MNRNQAVDLLPIIKAFSEGISIQYRIKDNKSANWNDVDKNYHEFSPHSFQYRIKPKSAYRPFANAEECWQEMPNHQPFGWVKWNDVRYNIYVVSSTSVCLINGNCEHMDFAYAYQKLTFADGVPFGVKAKED